MTADEQGAPRKPGRPPTGEERKESASFTLPRGLLAKLTARADATARSRSQIVEEALRVYLEKEQTP